MDEENVCKERQNCLILKQILFFFFVFINSSSRVSFIICLICCVRYSYRTSKLRLKIFTEFHLLFMLVFLFLLGFCFVKFKLNYVMAFVYSQHRLLLLVNFQYAALVVVFVVVVVVMLVNIYRIDANAFILIIIHLKIDF